MKKMSSTTANTENLVSLHDQLIARKFYLRLADEHSRTNFGVETKRSRENMNGYIVGAARDHHAILTQSPLMHGRNAPNTTYQTENDHLISHMNDQQRKAASDATSNGISNIQNYQKALVSYHDLAQKGKLSTNEGRKAEENLNAARDRLPLMVKRGLNYMAQSYGFSDVKQFDKMNVASGQAHLFRDNRSPYPTIVHIVCNIAERYYAVNSVDTYNRRYQGSGNAQLQKDYEAHEAGQRKLKWQVEPQQPQQQQTVQPRVVTPGAAQSVTQSSTARQQPASISTRSDSPTQSLDSPRSNDSSSSNSPPPKPPRSAKTPRVPPITMTAVASTRTLPQQPTSPLPSPVASEPSSLRTASASPRSDQSSPRTAASSPRSDGEPSSAFSSANTTPRNGVATPPASPRGVNTSPTTPRRVDTRSAVVYSSLPADPQANQPAASTAANHDLPPGYSSVPPNTQTRAGEMTATSAPSAVKTHDQYSSVRAIDRHAQLVSGAVADARKGFYNPASSPDQQALVRPLPAQSMMNALPLDQLLRLPPSQATGVNSVGVVRPLPPGPPPAFPPANDAMAKTVANSVATSTATTTATAATAARQDTVTTGRTIK